jgi:HAD superfamily phosphatase
MALNEAKNSVLVFDMDGVLVDVLESYRASVMATVEHFTGAKISNDVIQQYKNAGGWNDDWELSQRLVRDIGKLDVPLDEVVSVFQKYFLGANNDGLILRERWLPANGLMERLAAGHQLAIFTGRPRAEMEITLSRFVPSIAWATTVTAADVANLKPAPNGLLRISEEHADGTITYVGDNVDDGRSARAAGVRFIGVAERRSDGLRELLEREGAAAVIENINEIEEVL